MTPFNDIGGGRYVDDASKKSFKYDHLRKEASDIQPTAAESGAIESWRAALQKVFVKKIPAVVSTKVYVQFFKELDAYIDDHYSKSGVGCVFVRHGNVTLCIESHQFQPKNFWYDNPYICLGVLVR